MRHLIEAISGGVRTEADWFKQDVVSGFAWHDEVPRIGCPARSWIYRRIMHEISPLMFQKQTELTEAVFLPQSSEGLGLSVLGKKPTSHDRGLQGPLLSLVAEIATQLPGIVMVEELLATAPAVAPDAGAGIGVVTGGS